MSRDNNNNSNNFPQYHEQFDMNSEYLPRYQETQNYSEQIHGFSPEMSSPLSNTNINFPLFSTQTRTNDHFEDEVEENVVENLTPTSANVDRANYTVKEDQALISSFIRVSEDATIGTNQNKGVFWQRVHEQYELARAANPAIRPRHTGKLDNRFRRISTIIMKWSSCYETACRRKASGWNEERVLGETRVLYKNRFNLDHAWDMLKVHPKWKTLIAPFAIKGITTGPVEGKSTGGQTEDSTSSGKRVRVDDGEYSTPTSIDVESVSTQRPEGRQASKRNKGKKKMNNVEYEDMSTRFAMMNEATERDVALAREKLEFKKKNAEVALKQLEYNNKREARKIKDQDWHMLQQLLQTPSLPPQLEKLKCDLLNKFGGQ